MLIKGREISLFTKKEGVLDGLNLCPMPKCLKPGIEAILAGVSLLTPKAFNSDEKTDSDLDFLFCPSLLLAVVTVTF